VSSDLTVTRLSTTPVKGLQLHHPDAIDLTQQGAKGDRLFYLLDDHGKLQNCTRNQALYELTATYDPSSRRLTITRGETVVREGVVEPDERVPTDMWGLRSITGAVIADRRWSEFFSDVTGKNVRLLSAASEPAHDVRPATLLGLASVAELARQAGSEDVDARRFRMLIEFAGGAAHVEDSWDGILLEVGGAVLRGGGPVQRCAATTRDPDSGHVDLQTLRLITSYRGRQGSVFGMGANFGVYADVVEPGIVSVGDALKVRSHFG